VAIYQSIHDKSINISGGDQILTYVQSKLPPRLDSKRPQYPWCDYISEKMEAWNESKLLFDLRYRNATL